MPIVDGWGGTGWPWSWYLRDVRSGFYDMSAARAVQLGTARPRRRPDTKVMQPRLDGLHGRALPAACMVVPVWDATGPGDSLRWAAFREGRGRPRPRRWTIGCTSEPELARLDASDK